MKTNKDKLVEDHLGLVYYIVHRYYPRFIGDEDLISEGFVALCQAAQVHNENKGKFSTYACTAILNRIRKYFRSEMKHKETSSLDFEIKDSDGHSATMHELIADEDSYKPFDMVERDLFVDSLDEREQAVVALVNEGCSQSEIAEKLNIGQATVSRVVTRVKAKWRKMNGED
jgi:RNA polymerase sigma factor (sigma-70 family)